MTEWPGFYSGCLLNDPIFWRVHILPDRPLLLTWSRHIPVTSNRECSPPPPPPRQLYTVHGVMELFFRPFFGVLRPKLTGLNVD